MKILKADFHITPETSQLGWPATGAAGDGLTARRYSARQARARASPHAVLIGRRKVQADRRRLPAPVTPPCPPPLFHVPRPAKHGPGPPRAAGSGAVRFLEPVTGGLADTTVELHLPVRNHPHRFRPARASRLINLPWSGNRAAGSAAVGCLSPALPFGVNRLRSCPMSDRTASAREKMSMRAFAIMQPPPCARPLRGYGPIWL